MESVHDDKLPPHELEAEMALLGSMILSGVSNAAIIAAVIAPQPGGSGISADDYFMPKHADIHRAIVALHRHHGTVDSVQLTKVLRDRGQYEAVGGIDYLVELSQSVPTCVNAPHYAKIVKESSERRGLIEELSTLQRQLYSPRCNVMELTTQLRERMDALQIKPQPSSQRHVASEYMASLIDRIQRDGMPSGILTGCDELDARMRGFGVGQMCLLAGRTSMGKSAVNLNFMLKASSRGTKAALITREDSAEKVGIRIMSRASGIDSNEFYGMTPDDAALHSGKWQRALKMCKQLDNFLIDDDYDSHIDEIVERVGYYANEGCKLIAVDHIHLLSSDQEGSEAKMAEISKKLCNAARQHEVALIGVAQLNRQPASRKDPWPTLTDLRASGALEQDARQVLLIHRPDYYEQESHDTTSSLYVIVAKNTHGAAGFMQRFIYQRHIHQVEEAPASHRDSALQSMGQA